MIGVMSSLAPRPRQRGAAILIAALAFLLLCLMFGRTSTNSRISQSEQSDAGYALTAGTQRLRKATHQADLVARNEAVRRAQPPGELVAPAPAPPAFETIEADNALFKSKSLVILSSGAKRVLVLDNRKYAAGDRLPDESVLVGIEPLRLHLLDKRGRKYQYELASSKTRPEDKGEKQ